MSSFRIVAAAAILAALAAHAPFAIAQSAPAETVALTVESDGASHVFEVEVADDPAERAKGLMFRREMAGDAGMLFDFEEVRPVSMWMKNTYLPLDMLFIAADGEIASIARRTTPLSERTVSSGAPVRYVLEINGGRAAALGIEPGDRVTSPAMDGD